MIERPDYDPEWVRRWRRAQARLEDLPDDATEAQRRAALEAIYRAHDAGFRTVADFSQFRFTALRKKALRLGYHLAMQPLQAEATDADVDALWRSALLQLQAVERADRRRPLRQPDGLTAFGPERALGSIRITYVAEPLPSGRYQHWTALIELGRAEADICLIQTDRVRGPFGGFAELATAVYENAFGRPWWRGPARPRPRRVRFYSYVPWGLHETGSELFHRRHLTWSRGRYVEDFERRHAFETVPELLAQFDPPVQRPHLLIPVAKTPDA